MNTFSGGQSKSDLNLAKHLRIPTQLLWRVAIGNEDQHCTEGVSCCITNRLLKQQFQLIKMLDLALTCTTRPTTSCSSSYLTLGSRRVPQIWFRMVPT